MLTLILRVVVGRFQRSARAAPCPRRATCSAATLAHALSAAFVVIVWVVAGMLILNYLDVPLAPFIASARIAGVALGFGAQSIVKDTLTGFFILLENQFGVGDIVEIRTPAGRSWGGSSGSRCGRPPSVRTTGRCTSCRTATSCS